MTQKIEISDVGIPDTPQSNKNLKFLIPLHGDIINV